MLDPYERLIPFVLFYFGKMWNFLEKRPFFRADLAGLGKYCTGGFGRIGVHRVKEQCSVSIFNIADHDLVPG